MSGEIRIPPDGPEQVRKIRGDAVEMIRMCLARNQTHPHEVPFDVGPERVLVALCDRALRAAEAGDGDTYWRLAHEMVEQAVRSFTASVDDAGADPL